jgi:hypothetical protein
MAMIEREHKRNTSILPDDASMMDISVAGEGANYILFLLLEIGWNLK